MAREISIVIAAKNMVGRGLDSARGSFKRFASAVKGFAGGIKKAVLGIGAVTGTLAVGLAGVAKKTVAAFSVQEDAVNQLSAAVAKAGADAATVVPKFEAFASAMQQQTRFGDEAILSVMAYGQNLGITTDKMELATQAAIGLAAKFNIDLKTAMMLVGRASQGQTQMLTRYGIVMEDTLSPQDKFNKLLAIGADNFSLAQAEAQTTAGKMTQLSNKYGDLQEKIGAAIVNSGIFEKALTFVSTKLDELMAGDRIQVWADNAVKALKAVAPVVRGIGKAFALVKGGIEKGAAFAGAIAGGSSIKDAIKIAKEQKSTFDVSTGAGGAAKQAAEGKKVLDELAQKREALAKSITAKETKAKKDQVDEVAKKQADAEKKLADLRKQLNDEVAAQNAEDEKDMFAKQAKQNLDEAQQMEKRADELQFARENPKLARQQERERKQKERDAERLQKKVDWLKDRRKKKLGISKKGEALLEEFELREGAIGKKGKAAQDLANKRMREEKERDELRNVRLKNIEDKIDAVMRQK